MLFDTELSTCKHVWRVAQTCFFHLCRLHSVCRQLDSEMTAKLDSALVFSRLDYCDTVLAGLPMTTLAPLQRVLIAAVRTVLDMRPGDHLTPAL